MNDGVEHKLAEIVWQIESVSELDMLHATWLSLVEVKKNFLEEMNKF